MNIAEVKALKKKLEASLKDEIAAFCRQTGTSVADLRLEKHEIINASGEVMERRYTVRVLAEI